MIFPLSSRTETLSPVSIVAPVSLAFNSDVYLIAPGKSKAVTIEVTTARVNTRGTLRLEVPAGWLVAPVAQETVVRDHAVDPLGLRVGSKTWEARRAAVREVLFQHPASLETARAGFAFVAGARGDRLPGCELPRGFSWIEREGWWTAIEAPRRRPADQRTEDQSVEKRTCHAETCPVVIPRQKSNWPVVLWVAGPGRRGKTRFNGRLGVWCGPRRGGEPPGARRGRNASVVAEATTRGLSADHSRISSGIL